LELVNRKKTLDCVPQTWITIVIKYKCTKIYLDKKESQKRKIQNKYFFFSNFLLEKIFLAYMICVPKGTVYDFVYHIELKSC